jgi:reverse gyrase
MPKKLKKFMFQESWNKKVRKKKSFAFLAQEPTGSEAVCLFFFSVFFPAKQLFF